MPGVNIRIVKESSTTPSDYETLVEADSENTKVTVESKSIFCSLNKINLFYFLKIQMNLSKVNYSYKVQLYSKNIGENAMKLVQHLQPMVVSSKPVISVVMIPRKMFSQFVVDNLWT